MDFKDTRPHMLLKKPSLHIDRLRTDWDRKMEQPSDRLAKAISKCRVNLQQGITQYQGLAGRVGAKRRQAFLKRLNQLRHELSGLVLKRKVNG